MSVLSPPDPGAAAGWPGSDDEAAALVHAHLVAPARTAGRRVAFGRAETVAEVRRRWPLASAERVEAVAGRVLARAEGLGALAPLLVAPDVTDILVNGPGPVWVERHGHLDMTDVVLDRDEIDRFLERLVAPLGLRVDRSSPIVDARLPDGSRVNAVVPPLAVDGPVIAIRRFTPGPRRLDDFAAGPVADLLHWGVAARANILVAGGTGAGKTSLLGALAALLPAGQRVVTVEDTAELCLAHGHVVRLEARPANGDGAGAVSIRELVRTALRLRPDRILVGEVRGPEALDMLQAMNTGHEGSLSTCHANSPADALRRLETMVLLDAAGLPLPAVREQVAGSIDLVVQVTRDRDGRRRVTQVAEPEPDVDPSGRVPVRVLARGPNLVARPARPARNAEVGPPPSGSDDPPSRATSP